MSGDTLAPPDLAPPRAAFGLSSTRGKVALLAALALGAFGIAFAVRAYGTIHPLLAAGETEAAEQHVKDLAVFLAIGGFASGLAIALGVWAVATAPLANLTRTVRSMRHDLGLRSGMRGNDDFAGLGEALDDLAAWMSSEKTSLEDDRNRLAAILESMAEGVLVTGRTGQDDGVIVLANAALREMLLLDRRILGRPPLEAIRLSELDDILSRAASSSEGASGEVEIVGLRPRRILVRAAQLRSSRKGAAAGLVAVFNDVTDLRRLESHRRDFVANVSHELRTPMTAIRAATETLQGGAVSDPAVSAEFLAIIARHTDRLQRLVGDLLELSKIEGKEWLVSLEELRLRDAIAGAIETISAVAKDRAITLRNDVDASMIVKGDRRALDQVLVNLLDNAVKYSGPRANVVIGARRDGERTVFHVKDDGPGIEARHLPRIFERFYRVDAGRSRAVGGTGLGLSIVKHLVEAMSGTIEVKSTPGAGTTFEVTLSTG